MVSGLSRRRSSEAPVFQHAIEGAIPPDLGCLSIQRYGTRCIRPLEAGAAVLVYRRFVRIAPAEQAPFVDWVERVDKHVGATRGIPAATQRSQNPATMSASGAPARPASVNQAGNSLR